MKYIEKIIDVTTGLETLRPYTKAEIALAEAEQATHNLTQFERDAEQAARAAARQVVLDKLGLTADEVTALLG